MNRQLIEARMGDGMTESMIGSARGGSTEALGCLFEQARGPLLHAANHELPPELRAKQSAADLVQETFLVAHRQFHRFHGRTMAELLLWLKAILRNTSAHLRRSYRTERRGTFREVPIDAPGSLTADLSSSDSSPSALFQRREAVAMLQEATARLSARDREVLWMKHHDELTFEEVGRKLAISSVAARKAWLKALERLREQLDRA
jgi:RNA polymerase sigma-70 factor (ECF subfamily)